MLKRFTIRSSRI